MLLSYEKIHKHMTKEIDADFANINIANQITNIIFSAFIILRQRVSGSTGNTERKAKDKKTYTVTTMGTTFFISFDDALKLVEESAQHCELSFKRFDLRDEENWYGTAAPYLDFFGANQLRLTELRLGHNNMPMGKSNDQTKSFPVKKYGFNGSHHVLLEGSRYPPEKKELHGTECWPRNSTAIAHTDRGKI